MEINFRGARKEQLTHNYEVDFKVEDYMSKSLVHLSQINQ